MLKFTRMAATVVAAATIATGAAALTAPSAQAQIRSGHYTYTVWGDAGNTILTEPAIVRGNRMYLVHERTWYDIHPTSRGGYIVAEMNNRRDFWRAGAGYTGISHYVNVPAHPSITARVTLVPR